MSLTERLRSGWNAFMGRDPTPKNGYGVSTSIPSDRRMLTRGSERTVVSAVYNRIAMDVAAVNIDHVRVDVNENYAETMTKSNLRRALRMSANIDQTGREFIQDLVLSMFDEGVVAAVPVDTTRNPFTGAFDIISLRCAKILEWYPAHVKVRVYNDHDGQKYDKILPKSMVAIITNPLYEVMNRPNSVTQRLIRKMALLDSIDEKSGTGKLDMIIQLPYVIKTEERRTQAEKRRRDIETQLNNSKLGIAYTDGTERITQLNRSLDNNLQTQIEYLTRTLYSQLGLTQAVFDGTADERAMLNYNDRTVTPILMAITEEMTRKFLTPTAISQGQRIDYMQDPFRLVPVSQIATVADTFTRNEIMSSNEVRALIGFKPIDNPQADELRNKNLNRSPNDMDPALAVPQEEGYDQEYQYAEDAEAGYEEEPEADGGDDGYISDEVLKYYQQSRGG